MSTLHVENLKGLSSGGNANKIIVPSGQTLDASAGTIAPSVGQVVQVQKNVFDLTGMSTSATSMTDLAPIYVDITPVYSNSILIWETCFSGYLNDADGHGRYRVVNANNSDAVLHNNTYCGMSHYNVGTNTWENFTFRAVGVSGTTSTMRLHLQVKVTDGGTLSMGWSASDQRIVTVTEIKQ